MSDATGLSVALPRDRHFSGAGNASANIAPIDVAATYRFPFARQRWLVGGGAVVQATLMIITGTFLWTQMSSTPNLAVQVGIVGTLLTVGGIVILARTWGDFFGGLKIDHEGVRASLGWSGFAISWPNVTRWRVSEVAAQMAELSSIEIWTADSEFPRVVPGGRLSEQDHHRIRQLFYAFAEGKEDA